MIQKPRNPSLPGHWVLRNDSTFVRSDGVSVTAGLNATDITTRPLDAPIGWFIGLPVTPGKNGFTLKNEFLPAGEAGTVEKMLRKVDIVWPPPQWVADAFPGDWLGSPLEQLAATGSAT